MFLQNEIETLKCINVLVQKEGGTEKLFNVKSYK